MPKKIARALVKFINNYYFIIVTGERLKYIIVVNGPRKENEARLRAAREVYNPSDLIVANIFPEDMLEEILDGTNYINVNERPTDTIDNALITRDYITKHGDLDEEIVVVTSDYHLPRTEYVFSKIFDKEVEGVGAKVEVPSFYKLFEIPQLLLNKLMLMYNPSKEEYHRWTQLVGKLKGKIRGKLKS